MSHSKRPQIIPGLLALFATLVATAIGDPVAIADESGSVIRTLVEHSDAVLQGVVRRTWSSARGQWHRFDVERVLAGRDPGERVALFTHGADVPDAPRLRRQERVILGVRWLDERDSYHARLLSSFDRREPDAPEGLVCSDAVLRVAELDEDALETLALALHRPKTGAEAETEMESDGDEEARALRLITSSRPELRVEGLRILDAARSEISEHARAAIRSAFATELAGGGSARTLRAFLDFVRNRSIRECGKTICGIAITRDEPDLVEEAIEAVASLAPRDGLEIALAGLPGAAPREQARLVRVVSAMDWDGAATLIETVIQSGDSTVVRTGIQALGEMGSTDATALLADIATHTDGTSFRLALESLARQRTPVSRAVVARLIEAAPPEERSRLAGIVGRVTNPLRQIRGRGARVTR